MTCYPTQIFAVLEVGRGADIRLMNIEVAKINDTIKHVLLDTTYTSPAVVSSNLVRADDMKQDRVCVVFANGKQQNLPVVHVDIDCGYVTGKITASVIENKPFNVLFGCVYLNPHLKTTVNTLPDAKQREN